MRRVLLAVLLLALVSPAWAADLLAEARRLYNIGQYEAAERVALQAMAVPAMADAARVVFGRIKLERYRQSDDSADLTAAREALVRVDSRVLDTHERVELVIGLAGTLYLERRFGAAAELFESVLDRSVLLGSSAHERVLDWWATALDREAQTKPLDDWPPIYERILTRMRLELTTIPGSTAANYWVAAAARAKGDPDAAWHAAIAGWARAALADDRGAALRADLDRLMMQAIIPERAARLADRGDVKQARITMLSEWEAFKTAWSR